MMRFTQNYSNEFTIIIVVTGILQVELGLLCKLIQFDSDR